MSAEEFVFQDKVILFHILFCYNDLQDPGSCIPAPTYYHGMILADQYCTHEKLCADVRRCLKFVRNKWNKKMSRIIFKNSEMKRFKNSNRDIYRHKQVNVRSLLMLAILPALIAITFGCDTLESTDETSPGKTNSSFLLATNSSPEEGGVVTPETGNHIEGTEIELSAEPSENWRFVEWQGDLNVSDSKTKLIMDGDKQVTAVFSLREYPLMIEVDGDGRVKEEIVESLADTSYQHGTTVRLTAVPNEGWEFTGWQGDLSGTTNPETIVVDSERSVTAVFSLKEYPLVIKVDGEGRVEGEIVESLADTSFGHDTTVRLTAQPDEGWQFTSWQGDLSGTANPETIVVDSEKSVTAVFQRLEYVFNFTINGQGNILTDPDQSVFHYGDEVVVTAKPAVDWRFTGWSGDFTGSESEKTTIITGDELTKSITADFVEIVQPLWAMGYNHNGQLGDGTREDRNVPVQGIRGFFEVEQIEGGGWHSLIIGQDGRLFGMGYNENGQLGDGTNIQRVDPVVVADEVSVASASEDHSLIIKTDGSLWATGGNEYGQLGDGSTNMRNTFEQIHSNVTGMAAGDHHSLYITLEGELWGMGKNTYGQLGFARDLPVDSVVANPHPVRINHSHKVVQVVAGGGHTLFIDSRGFLFGLGNNSSGQLGAGAQITYSEEPLLIAENVQNVSAGRDHSLFVQDGALYAMGSNSRGQLGTGDSQDYLEPELIDTDVNLVAGGLNHSLYVKNDATLWGMGENARGQLGDGSGLDQDTPINIDQDVIRLSAGIRHTLFVKRVTGN